MDRQYIAKQFNGPIISAFVKAVYDFIHKECKVDSNVNYFSKLSIANAEEYQLNTIGNLMGIQRFGIIGVDTSDANSITFTTVYEDQSYYTDYVGFGEEYVNRYLNPDYPAGKFAPSNAITDKSIALPTDQYRALVTSLSVYKNIVNIPLLIQIISTFLGSKDFTLVRSQDELDMYDLHVSRRLRQSSITQCSIILNNLYKNYIQFNIIIE